MDDTGTQLKYSKHSDDVSIGWKNMPMPLSGRAPQSQTLSDGLMEHLSKVDFLHHLHHLYLDPVLCSCSARPPAEGTLLWT